MLARDLGDLRPRAVQRARKTMVGSGRGREKVRNMGERVGGSRQAVVSREEVVVVRQRANSEWRGIWVGKRRAVGGERFRGEGRVGRGVTVIAKRERLGGGGTKKEERGG